MSGEYPVIHMVPGPVSVPARILEAMCRDSDLGHIRADFLGDYLAAAQKLAAVMGTRHEVIMMSGEAMAILWGALKSCLKPGERLLCVDTGVFGAGFADMGRALGLEVELVSFAPDSTLDAAALERIEEAARRFRPKLITAVHCDTPSGTLNPLEGLGEIKRRLGVPLLAVDAVGSIGTVAVTPDEWGVDILMGGSQKGLSAPPCMGFAAVSPAAWDEIRAVGYQGYDAFLPFAAPKDGRSFPYTPFRQGVAALDEAAAILLEEGLENVFARHERAAALCREGVRGLGLELFPRPDAVPAPGCTAVKMPRGLAWPELQRRMLGRGLVCGGGLGFLDGRLFRLGHMGNQARPELVNQAIAILGEVL